MRALEHGPRGLFSYLMAQFVVEGGPRGSGYDGGMSAFILSIALGAFCGLVLGVMISHILRYIAFLRGRTPGGFGWAIYGALLGAVAFALLTVLGNRQEAAVGP